MNFGEIDIMTRFRDWEFFGTLTFRGYVPRESVRAKMGFGYLYRVARLAGVQFSQLAWVLRAEQGEIGGRHHFHYLLSRTNMPLTVSSNFRLMKLWEQMGGGMARVHVFDRLLCGPEYIGKCLSGVGTVAGDFYESSKFGLTAEHPIISKSVLKTVSRPGNGFVVGVIGTGRCVSCSEPAIGTGRKERYQRQTGNQTLVSGPF